MKIKIFADQYTKEKKNFNFFSDDDVIPVDLNGGFVPFDKYGAKNATNSQESIQERFSLEPLEDGGEA